MRILSGRIGALAAGSLTEGTGSAADDRGTRAGDSPDERVLAAEKAARLLPRPVTPASGLRVRINFQADVKVWKMLRRLKRPEELVDALRRNPAWCAGEFRNLGGRTPLHWALGHYGDSLHVQHFEDLAALNVKALRMVDGVGMTPLHTAAAFSKHEVVEAVLALCPQAASMRDKRRRFPLHLALSGIPNKPRHQPSRSKVKLLLEVFPQAANAPDDTERFALHYYCMWYSMLDSISTILKCNPLAAKSRDVLGFYPLQLLLRHDTPPPQVVHELAAIFPEAAQHEPNNSPQVLYLEDPDRAKSWGVCWQNQPIPSIVDEADKVVPWHESDDTDTDEEVNISTETRMDQVNKSLQAAHAKAAMRATKEREQSSAKEWVSANEKAGSLSQLQSLREKHISKVGGRQEEILVMTDFEEGFGDPKLAHSTSLPPELHASTIASPVILNTKESMLKRRSELELLVIEGIGPGKYEELYTFLSGLPPLLVGDLDEDEILARKIELEHMLDNEEHMAFWPLLDEIVLLDNRCRAMKKT